MNGRHVCGVAQDVQQENQSAAIDKKDITQVLHSRNLLRLAEKIQISPNRRYVQLNLIPHKQCKPSAQRINHFRKQQYLLQTRLKTKRNKNILFYILSQRPSGKRGTKND